MTARRDAAPAIGAFTLHQLGARSCRWPFGESPYLFCGADTGDPVQPWCPEHHARATTRKPTAEERRIGQMLRDRVPA